MANRKRRRARGAGEKRAAGGAANCWLVLRRLCQFFVLGMFLERSVVGVWICTATTAVARYSTPFR